MERITSRQNPLIDHRQLLSEQVSAFHALAASLKEHA